MSTPITLTQTNWFAKFDGTIQEALAAIAAGEYVLDRTPEAGFDESYLPCVYPILFSGLSLIGATLIIIPQQSGDAQSVLDNWTANVGTIGTALAAQLARFP